MKELEQGDVVLEKTKGREAELEISFTSQAPFYKKPLVSSFILYITAQRKEWL